MLFRIEVKWLATKLKMFSFLSYKQEITAEDVKAYSTACLELALREYKGLPRGVQNGVVSFSVLAADRVDKTAADFVLGKPPKHYAAFEFPMIYDLTYNALVYNHNKPMWGALYYGYFMEYAEKNFSANP
jgi:hypothetical protein